MAATLTPQNYYENIHRIGIFDIGSSILLLTAHLFKNKNISYTVLLYVLLMIALFLLFGRRGKLIETGLLLMFMVWIRVKSPLLTLHDRMKIYFSGLLAIFVILAFSYIFESTLAFQRGFSKAGFEESRGLVLEDFLIDFNKTSEWMFGRGIDGNILRTINLETGTESLIENGYLTVILKGGLLYLIPMVIIILTACY
ncbi:MAG: hypothetical protein IH591_06130, partial [Bacteroidales bacterium]|nr:hypothetical protein [Bacteroidales bacterium]